MFPFIRCGVGQNSTYIRLRVHKPCRFNSVQRAYLHHITRQGALPAIAEIQRIIGPSPSLKSWYLRQRRGDARTTRQSLFELYFPQGEPHVMIEPLKHLRLIFPQ